MADLLIDRHDHISVFTLNRPEKMNSLGGTLSADLTSAMAEFDADPDQYVAIITGAGDRAFSAGADLNDLAARTSTGSGTPSVGVSTVDLWGVGGSPKPVIAAVNGLAVAGGLELSLNCDIRIAADSAWFGVFEVKRGIMAGIAVNLLARYMPLGDALYMLMTADRVPAAEALRLGLVQKVVPADELMAEALRVAEMIAANSQVAVQASKQVAYFWRNLAIRESLDYYQAVNQRLMLCDDVLEGPRAFAEKRPPEFTNRWPEDTRPQ
jgi:enoyl-CoA hydratase/carnithine racemase